MNCSMPGSPVLHDFPESAKIHVHWVSDDIQNLILWHPLLLLPSILPRIRVCSNESTLCISWLSYWSFSFSISPFNEYSGLISFRTNLSTWKIFSKDWITFRSSESGGNGKFSRFSTLSLGVRLAQTSLRFQCSGKMAVITHQDWYVTGYIH